MALRRLSGEFKDDVTCPGIWADDHVPNEVLVVGHDVDPSPFRSLPASEQSA